MRIDDSIYSRNRSKSVELLAKVFDHSTRQFVNGFQLLTLGWSDFQTLDEAKVYLSMDIFQCQLSNWITSLPRYIKDCLHISVCES